VNPKVEVKLFNALVGIILDFVKFSKKVNTGIQSSTTNPATAYVDTLPVSELNAKIQSPNLDP
jgi:hypothetical protein